MKKNKILQAVLGLVLVSMPLFAATTIIKIQVLDIPKIQQS